MWAFKSLWDKGLVYEGYRVLAVLLALRDAAVQHRDAHGRRLPRPPGPGAHGAGSSCDDGRRRGAWPGRRRRGRCRRTSPSPSAPTSTTPWSTPTTVSATCSPRPGVGAYERELGRRPRVVGTLQGAELVGRRYTPLFPFFADQPNAFQVLAADFVSTEDGTGVVHLAPGFGEDDQNACAEADGIAVVCPMDEARPLHRRGAAVGGRARVRRQPRRHPRPEGRAASSCATRRYDHAYPHCWRCSQAARLPRRVVVVRAGDQVPRPHGRAQPADPLGARARPRRQLRQVAGARPRLVDQPQPLLGFADPGVEERRSRATPASTSTAASPSSSATSASTVTDLHRPAVDDLVRPNPDDPTGQSMMRRVPEVLDCWFESGSMPFAQVHYPFENADWFEHHYPGDFIVEYIGQTRGWFYTLHVLATALFDRPAFQTCVSHGIVLGNDGQKMSKSLRNYPDPFEMFDTYGADAMRWFLLSSADPARRRPDRDRAGHPRRRPPGAAAAVERLVLLHAVRQRRGADTAARCRTDQTGVLDRYLLAKLHDLVGDAHRRRWTPTTCSAPARRSAAFLDVLTNWYIRRSRDRFWAGEADAFDTLHTALHVLTRRGGAAAAARHRGGLPGADGRAQRAPRRLARRRRPARPTPTSSRPWTRCATCARRRCRSARRRACGCACRCRRSPSPVPTPTRSRPFADIVRDEVNVKEVELDRPTSGACGDRSSCSSCRLRSARASAPTPSASSARCKAGDWTEAAGAVVAGGVDAARRRVHAAAGRRRRRRRSAALPGNAGPRPARHRGHAGAGGRGPGARPGADRPAGPARRRPARERPHPPRRAGAGRRRARPGAVPALRGRRGPGDGRRPS